MLVPKLFTEDLFDDWMDDLDWNRGLSHVNQKLYGKHSNREMLTDVREHEDHFDVEMDLPGFKKEDIKVELNSGYLTITASKGLEESEENKEGKLVRKERYSGMMSRSFFVGEELTNEDIKAKFENGVLTLCIPKMEKKEIVHNSTVTIE